MAFDQSCPRLRHYTAIIDIKWWVVLIAKKLSDTGENMQSLLRFLWASSVKRQWLHSTWVQCSVVVVFLYLQLFKVYLQLHWRQSHQKSVRKVIVFPSGWRRIVLLSRAMQYNLIDQAIIHWVSPGIFVLGVWMDNFPQKFCSKKKQKCSLMIA